jgi:carbonic anhydrase
MRTSIALFACCFVIATANASDAPASAAASAPAPAAAAPAVVAKPVIATPKLTAAQAAAAQQAREDQAEAELSAKIAARLAVMRANQKARIAAAAKAKKEADAKKKLQAEAAAEAVAAPVQAHGTHWSYEGQLGPANWSKINSEWSKCGTGNRQSPIDLRDGMKVDLEQIVFDYKPTSFSVIDNGHTIQVTMAGGNFITIMNRSFELLQFHFHRPSEERINGKGFEMVAHLVHRDAEGKLAVVAVLLERGKAQSVIQTVWNNLPLEKNDTVTPSVVLDVNDLLPARRDYFTYMGSLTTPPCSEGVLWLVMKEPVQASPQQMALFSRLYPLNARPIQASSGRVIKESN